MPFLIFAVGAISAIAFWIYRARNVRDASVEILGAANDVRLAARRFGFKRKTNVHPAENIDDARLAAAGVIHAIASMNGELTADQKQTMVVQFQSIFNTDKTEADEIVAFGRWIADQCGTKSEAVRRLTRRVAKLAGSEAEPDLTRLAELVIETGGQPETEDETDALFTIKRVFKG